METFLKCRPNVRTGLLQDATHRFAGMKSPFMMEKDFWLCYLLETLFSLPELNRHFIFKGDTAITKAYPTLQRFSDDCDISIDQDYLGITAAEIAKTKQHANTTDATLSDTLNRAMQNRVQQHILPALMSELTTKLNPYFEADTWKLISVKMATPGVAMLEFHYPKSAISHFNNQHVSAIIQIRFTLASHASPCEMRTITPYLYQAIPELSLAIQPIKLNTISATHSFWEKILVLHTVHYRMLESPLAKGLSKHYYDVVMLDNFKLTDAAIKNRHLLTEIIRYQQLFTSDSAMQVLNTDTDAKMAALKLQPPVSVMKNLQRDYIEISEFIFGGAPAFESILQKIIAIEKQLKSIPHSTSP